MGAGQSSQRRSGPRKDPLLGRVVDGRYTILHLLGKGGMGAVYRAHQASLDRAVALKILLGAPDRSRENEFQRRFFLEASTVAKLKHPNTITVFDYGSEEVADLKVYFIAMELLEGRTLTQALKSGALELSRVMSISVQICRSLREAHRFGVIHRDLKPGNVMLMHHDDDPEGDQEFVKVLDFGLAKTWEEEEQNLTKAGTFLGSPRYVPPEQIEGRATDPRSDIYSLGCVMFRMVTGNVPFDGSAPVEIMLKHLNDPPPQLPAQTPPLLDKLIMAMLEKDPDNRPESMEEVLSRLKLVRAAAGERVGFLSMSDDSASQIDPSPVPLDRRKNRPSQASIVAEEDEEPAMPTRPDRRRPNSRSGAQKYLDTDRHPRSRPSASLSTPIEETRPTRGGLPTPPAPASKGSVFLRGVIAGSLVALSCLLAFELGLDEWLEAKLAADAPAEPAVETKKPAIRSRLVRLRIRSKPRATLLELIGSEQVRRGTTPLDLDWPVAEGAKARVFLLKTKKRGYAETPLAVPIPDDDGLDPQVIDVEVKLIRAK